MTADPSLHQRRRPLTDVELAAIPWLQVLLPDERQRAVDDLRSFALDNSSEVWTARVINDADCRVTYKIKCDRCINGVDGELHDVWIESKLRKHFTDARNYNGDRIHRPWVWLHNHSIPGDKSGEHSWRCVPYRER